MPLFYLRIASTVNSWRLIYCLLHGIIGSVIFEWQSTIVVPDRKGSMPSHSVVVIVGNATEAECARALAQFSQDVEIRRMSLHYICLAEEAVAELAGYHSVQDMWSAMPQDVEPYTAKYEQYVKQAVETLLERLSDADAIIIRESDWEIGRSDELLLSSVHERLFEEKPDLQLYLLRPGWTELQTAGHAISV